MRAKQKAEVSLLDIRREALGHQLNAEQTRSLLDGLVRAGWLKLVTTKTDGRAIHRWQVNPQLFSGAPTPERPERPERGAPHDAEHLSGLSDLSDTGSALATAADKLRHPRNESMA
jgi:hypothetical protein